jgi:hypothetical protein
MTKLVDIYESFLGKVSDYSFLTISEDEVNDELFGYFKTARTKFYRCKNSLELVDQDGEQVFTVELHPMEIEVLATIMLVEYLKPQMITSETLKQSLSDKDFKIYSQASQLREIRLLYQAMKADSNKLITEYTYLDLELDGDKQ